jgi:hypothetical protein
MQIKGILNKSGNLRQSDKQDGAFCVIALAYWRFKSWSWDLRVAGQQPIMLLAKKNMMVDLNNHLEPCLGKNPV